MESAFSLCKLIIFLTSLVSLLIDVLLVSVIISVSLLGDLPGDVHVNMYQIEIFRNQMIIKEIITEFFIITF